MKIWLRAEVVECADGGAGGFAHWRVAHYLYPII